MKFYRGIVEDNQDPMKRGRVRVRIYGIHSEDTTQVKTEELPWSEVMGGADFGLENGVGFSSILRLQTLVYVILEEDNPNKAIVLGTVKYNTTLAADSQPSNETYSNSATLHTEGGHTLELNDTAGHKTIRLAHNTGTMITMDNDGNLKIYAKKDANIAIDGNATVDLVGNATVHIAGNSEIISKGTTSIFSEGAMSIGSNSTIDIGATGDINLYGANVRFNEPGKTYTETDVVVKPVSLEAAMVDSPTSEPDNVQSVTSTPADYPQNPEQIGSGTGGMPAPGGEKTPEEGIPNVNPYDKANEALKLGNSAWRETGSNANIKKLWDELGYNGANFADQTAWCAVFVSAMLKRSGNNYIQTASSQAYREYGTEVQLADVQQGDIVIFYRDGINSGKGHVGFATGRKTSTTIEVLGGNQGDTLSVRTFQLKKGSSWGLRTIRRATSVAATVEPQHSTVIGDKVV